MEKASVLGNIYFWFYGVEYKCNQKTTINKEKHFLEDFLLCLYNAFNWTKQEPCKRQRRIVTIRFAHDTLGTFQVLNHFTVLGVPILLKVACQMK